jgi:hypothetical protein
MKKSSGIEFLFRLLILSFTLFMFMNFQQANAQQIMETPAIIDSVQNTGRIVIYQDTSITRLLKRQDQVNIRFGGIPNGYRIQIFSVSGNDAREKAREFNNRFLNNHPEFSPDEIYQLYQPPFFKLRVGDYRNKNEALIVYKKLVKYYPNCYIVKSTINFPKLGNEMLPHD